MAAHAESTALPGEKDTDLNPTLTRKMLLLFIVGDILGGGIYARTGEVAGEIGGAIWTGFALAAVIAVFTAASYAELVAKFPRAAGAALYIHKAFKRPLLTFVVAFAVMCSGVASAAALATAFGGDYLSEFVDLPTVLVALTVILIVSLINFRGIRESAGFNLACTLIELGGLFLVVLIGATFLFDGGGDPARAVEFNDDATPALLIVAGASIAFYALIGFEDAVNVAEETKDATRTFPRTLFMGLGLAGAVYLLVTVIAGMAVPAGRLADSDGPLLEVVTQGPLSVNSQVFSAIALFAIVNGCLLNLVMASRLMYGMSREGVVPGFLGKVHPHRQTPWAAIIFTASIAAVLAILGDLSTLADTTVLLLLLVFVGVHVSLLVLRRTPVDHDHFRAPTVLPWLGAVTCAGLAVQQMVEDPKLIAWAGGLLVFGLILWFAEKAVR
jgi:APA family basic amino acid/polyamine antiporter